MNASSAGVQSSGRAIAASNDQGVVRKESLGASFCGGNISQPILYQHGRRSARYLVNAIMRPSERAIPSNFPMACAPVLAAASVARAFEYPERGAWRGGLSGDADR